MPILLLLMTAAQRNSLLWLANAMTTPIDYTRRLHYYDGVHQLFFTRVMLDYCGTSFEVRDSFDMAMSEEFASDLLVKVELINDESSEIVEIPKLNVQYKVAIQTEFLQHFEGVVYYSEIQEAISRQQDEQEFVLDKVFIENDNAAPMAPYWDDYKLRKVMEYISSFANVIAANLKFLFL
jgi:hypothetical protein